MTQAHLHLMLTCDLYLFNDPIYGVSHLHLAGLLECKGMSPCEPNKGSQKDLLLFICTPHIIDQNWGREARKVLALRLQVVSQLQQLYWGFIYFRQCYLSHFCKKLQIVLVYIFNYLFQQDNWDEKTKLSFYFMLKLHSCGSPVSKNITYQENTPNLIGRISDILYDNVSLWKAVFNRKIFTTQTHN